MSSPDADPHREANPAAAIGPAAADAEMAAETPSPAETGPTARPLRRQELERYLQASPADLPAYFELAGIYRQEDRPAHAARVLKKALEFHPDNPDLLWEHEEASLARSLQQLREVTALASRLNTVEAQNEKDRCEANWAFRRIDVCRARLRRDPHAPHLRLTLAQTLKELQQYDEAIEESEAAAADHASAPTANLIRGQCLRAQGKRVAALAAFRAAALRRSNPAPARVRLAAMRAALEIAESLGLDLSARRYRQFLRLAETELAKQEDEPTPPRHPARSGHPPVRSLPPGSALPSASQDHHEPSDR